MHPNRKNLLRWDESQRTEREGGAVTSTQSLSLVRVFHQPRDLLHDGQSAIIKAVTQLDFAPVHYHVLVVVCPCNNNVDEEEEEKLQCKQQHVFIIYSSKHSIWPTRVVFGEGFGPLFSTVCQTMSQPDPLPCQQAVGGNFVKKRGVEDVVAGLRHHQATAQQIEIIQGQQESCGPVD